MSIARQAWVRLAVCALALLALASCGRKMSAPATVSTWQAIPLGTSADFRAVTFVDEDRGWIVGGKWDVAGGLIGRTQDRGLSWKFNSGLVPDEAGGRRCPLIGVHFVDGLSGVALGSCGAALRTLDGGNTWTSDQKPAYLQLFSVHFADAQRGWAIGESGMLVTADGGVTWYKMKDDEGRVIRGRAIQRAGDVLWVAGQHGKLASSSDEGRSWSSVDLPMVNSRRPDLWALQFTDAMHGWVVGQEGTILATRDGGATWVAQDTLMSDAHSAMKLEEIPSAKGVLKIDTGDRTPGLTLAAVHFVDSQRGWVAGHYANHARSLILGTADGGATWRLEADIAGEELRALGGDATALWAVGDRTREGMQSIYRRVVSAAPAK